MNEIGISLIGPGNAEFQICLLLVYKRITLASSVQKKNEQIMFEYPCTFYLSFKYIDQPKLLL